MLKKIASNTLSQVFSKFATAFISIFLLGILTKYLPLEMFGMYNKIYNYLGIFAFLADLGLYTITIREITNNKKDANRIIGNVLTLRLILGLVILLIAFAVALLLPGYQSSVALGGVAIIGVFTVVSLINSSVLALMQAYMKIEFSFISVVLGKLLTLGLIIYCVFVFAPAASTNDFSLPLLYIFGAGLIGISCTTMLNYIYAYKKIFPLSFQCDTSYIRHIFRISLPYGVALFLGVVYFKVDVIILSLIESPDIADISIALYSLPMKIVEVLMVLGGFYLNSILPSLSTAFKNKDTDTVRRLIDISIKVLAGFGVCVFVFGTLFSENIITIIANQDYIENTLHTYSSLDVFSIVLAVLFFHFLSLVFVYILIAVKQQSQLLYINLVVTIFNIVGNIIIIPHYSFLGAGIITVCSQLLLFIIGYIYVRKITTIRFDIMFLVFVGVMGVLCFMTGKILISLYSLGSIGDIIVYGGILSAVYSFLMYTYIKRSTISLV